MGNALNLRPEGRGGFRKAKNIPCPGKEPGGMSDVGRGHVPGAERTRDYGCQQGAGWKPRK